MNPDFIGELVNGAIPLLGGIYLTLLGYRKTGKQPGVSPSFDEWHRRYGRLLKIIGPALILFGPGLWLVGWARNAGPAAPDNWQRFSTADGVCSIEFPAPPTPTNQQVERVASTGMSLALQGKNSYFALTHSDETEGDPTLTDDQRLDLIRDNFPEAGHQIGVDYELIREQKITLNGQTGRAWDFDAGKKHSVRMRVFFIGTHCYRVIAAVPRKDKDSEQTNRFLNSFQIDNPRAALGKR